MHYVMQKTGECEYRLFLEIVRLWSCGRLICSVIFIWVNLICMYVYIRYCKFPVARCKIMFVMEKPFWDHSFPNVCIDWIVVLVNCVKWSLIYSSEFLNCDFIRVTMGRILWKWEVEGCYLLPSFVFFYGHGNWMTGCTKRQILILFTCWFKICASFIRSNGKYSVVGVAV
jgi:hypothetical protein